MYSKLRVLRPTAALPTVLMPRESGMVELRFAPLRRSPAFDLPLHVRYAGETKPLLRVRGAATGLEVVLEPSLIGFGIVCEGSRRKKPFVLQNTGDVPIRYRWDEGALGDHFSVAPLEGAVAPNAEAKFDAVFAPACRGDDLRAEGVQLFIDGSTPLALTLTGQCVEQADDSKIALAFASAARVGETQEVELNNPTDAPWFLAPVLAGDDWKCAAEVEVPAKGKAAFPITYLPLTMTEDAEPQDRKSVV